MPVIGQCALCLTDNVALIDSHIVPAWVYRALIDYDPNGGPNLVQVTGGRAIITGRQESKPLLCRACEDAFGIRETYVSDIRRQADGTFPALAQASVIQTHGSHRIADVSALDCDKILYFATSVIWRADVANIQPVVHLGESREALRQYLFGTAPFPAEAGLILKILDPPANYPRINQLAAFPETLQDSAHHAFFSCGLYFQLVTREINSAKLIAMPFERRAMVYDGVDLIQAALDETQTSTNYGSLARKHGK
jgi:hypothetical protein